MMHKKISASRYGARELPRPFRYGIGLLVGAVFAILSVAPGIANDDEPGCIYRLSVYVKTADAMLESDHSLILSSLEFYEALSKGLWLEGCTLEEVKAGISKSKFPRPVQRYSHDVWLFALTNGRVEIGFSYLAERRKSECHYQVWSKDVVPGQKIRRCPGREPKEKKGPSVS